MFGFGKQSSQAAKEREAAIEAGKQTVRDFVHSMIDDTLEATERKGQQLKDWCNNDKLLPFDFKQRAMKRAREMECAANQRQCDAMLHEAASLSVDDKMKERGLKLAEARKYFGKACKLGADDDWRKAYQRAEQTILMTGGMHHHEPSRAKPTDHAPHTPNRAKV